MTGSLKRGRQQNTWYLRVELPRAVDGSRRQRRETVSGTKAEAQKRLRALVREIETGGYAEGGRVSVAALSRDWLRAMGHRVGARTHANYVGHVEGYILPALGSIKAESLRSQHIEAALAWWMTEATNRRRKEPTPISPRTIAHVFATLRTMCNWAVNMGILVRDPSIAVKPPKVEAKEMRALDQAGVAAVVAAVRGTELEHAVVLAIGTGLRLGEIIGLRWSDIDLDANRLTVMRSVETVKGVTRSKPPKTKRSSRTIAVPKFAADGLRRHRAQQNERRLLLGLGGGDEYSVFSRNDESAWSPHVFSMMFARIVKSAGLPHVRFHDLRHTYGTQALASGVDLKTVSSSLGHATISTTANVYLHAVESLNEDGANRIDSLLGKAIDEGLRATPVPRLRAGRRKT